MQNNFSYPLKLEDMSASTKHYEFQATSSELQYIAEILKVPSIKSFKTILDVTFDKPQHMARIKGKIDAAVEQISVISLNQFTRKYQINFARNYDTKLSSAQQRELEEFEDINADIPDVMENGQIDLKAISMEELALELDDFPKQKGETFNFAPDFDTEADKPQNPFAVLEKLKK